MRPHVAGLLALALAAGALTASVAAAEDPFKEVETRYRKLARNHDDAATRERRKLILSLFDQRRSKACKKLLRDAYGEESVPDLRIAVVQVLAATGDPKDLDFLLAAFKKEKQPGPQIALAQGLSYTDTADLPVVAPYAAGLVAKQKGEPVRALLEGIGEMADPAAYPALAALGDKLGRAENFERLVALGACGREQAVEALDRARSAGDADLRLGAAIGLGRTGGPDQPPCAAALPILVELVNDGDPRVVEAAAEALGRAKHATAVEPLADALDRATLRTREALRAALKSITGRDAGHDAAAWKSAPGATAAPSAVPKIPVFAGLEVPSERVALLLDLSRSMDWNDRLTRARRAFVDYLHTAPDSAAIGAVAVGRTPEPQSPQLGTGGSAHMTTEEWFGKQLTSRGSDLRESLLWVLETWPAVDTILVATDSPPAGDVAEETALEVIQQFRRANRARRVRVLIAMTIPGGRHEQAEIDADEFEDRKDLLRQLAESTGGKLAIVE